MTDDARKAMDAWLFDTHRCTHDPMGLQRTPVIEYAPTDVWLCAYCLADLFARLQEAEALRTEWQQRCSEPLVIHFEARSVHALSRPCPLCPNPTLDAALAGTEDSK